MNKKGNILIIILVLIAILGISFVGFYYWSSSTKTPADRQNTQTSNETINWKTYTNQHYNFSLRYPPTWKFEESTKNSAYSFLLTFVYTKPDPSVIFKGIVIKENWSIDKELATYAKTDSNSVYPEVSNIHDISVNGAKGKQYYISTPAGADLKETVVELNNNLFIFISPKFDSNNNFDQILSTFKFL